MTSSTPSSIPTNTSSEKLNTWFPLSFTIDVTFDGQVTISNEHTAENTQLTCSVVNNNQSDPEINGGNLEETEINEKESDVVKDKSKTNCKFSKQLTISLT